MSLFSLTERVAIVTGGGRGIGKAIALAFAEAGANIVTAARTREDIETTADQIRMLGRRALAVPTDVCQPQQVQNMVERTLTEFGRVDILVNNAGGFFSMTVPTAELSETAWDEVVNLNLRAAFLCCKAAGKVMIQQKKGCIINISSGAGVFGRPGLAHYSAAKAGLNNLTQTLGKEWAPYNIRVNAIIPSGIATSGLKQFYAQQPPDVLQTRLKMIPMGRFGEVEEVSGAAVFLASDAASFITGATLLVDGGFTH